MTFALWCLISTMALEGLPHAVMAQRSLRSFFSWLSLSATALVALWLFVGWPSLFSLALLFLSGYRCVNMLRISKRRMHEAYLRTATRRSSLVLIGLQLLTIGAWLVWQRHAGNAAWLWTAVSITLLCIAAMLAWSTRRMLKKTAWPQSHGGYADKELPTVTVAIPARNETDELRLCLEAVLASDYPKLEVIVLDDCSQMKQTPEIIREYAHDGVRFVQGKEPLPHWLAKNQAYARLSEEASGEFILFCGVDVRMSTLSIRSMVSVALDRKKQMVCVLPLRCRNMGTGSSLVQAMRYCWELVLPRRALNRPPVLSTCWLIERQALERAGGFASVSRAVVPEAYFARQLITTDGYSFLRGDSLLGIESCKHEADQLETAVRMRYPQLHHRPENVALTIGLELFVGVLPFVLAIGGFWLSVGVVPIIIAWLTVVLLIAAYEQVILATRVQPWWKGWHAPIGLLVDIALVHASMWQYEFSTVEWKGRNVCIPVMHTTPRTTVRQSSTQVKNA